MVKMCVPNWPEAKVNQFHVVHTHTYADTEYSRADAETP